MVGDHMGILVAAVLFLLFAGPTPARGLRHRQIFLVELSFEASTLLSMPFGTSRARSLAKVMQLPW